jgi:glycosyltransferase involved in cell wall biosynthesis
MPSAQIEVIPNGVDLERFHPADPASTARRGPLKLLTVGRLSATKRVNLLIETVEHLHAEGAEVKLDIVGGGALETELRQFLARRDFRDVVTLAGRHGAKEMPEIYRRHDIFVSASSQEGMSNAMLEAMASGLPIVTTRCEGLDELIDDNGLIVEEAAPDALARAIKSLIDDPAKRQAMSVAARRRAEEFSWGAVAEAYLQLYVKVK